MTDLDLTQRDPAFLAKALPLLRPMAKYFRSEVRDIDRIPADTGALVVSNHSGGALAVDLPLIAVAFFDEFGTERELFCLAHDSLFMGPLGPVMRKAGLVPATRENAAAVLQAGAVTVVFPGGDHDTLRPSRLANVIDFAGRTGYVRTALEAGVPIVPVVSIGGQETQLFISRGERLNRLFQVQRFMRSKYFPLSFGFPWGLTGAFPMNVPLPSKIVTQVLEPIDLGGYADRAADDDEHAVDDLVAEIDERVRGVMQEALTALAKQRRFPVLG
jgi:1-acyl-sn-glycerol-3-phosphate acyltransferase